MTNEVSVTDIEDKPCQLALRIMNVDTPDSTIVRISWRDYSYLQHLIEDGKGGRDGGIRRHAVGKSWLDEQPPWRAVRCLKSERNSSKVTWKRMSPVLGH